MAVDLERGSAVIDQAGPGAIRYRVGTLHYTRSAILTVLFWMLWADLCLQIMEQIPSVINLQLKWLGARDTLIGLLNGSMPNLIGVSLCPIVGMQSDRHRGPLGRRRPFLLWFTPPMVAFLLLLGFSTPISDFVHARLGPATGLSHATIGISIITIFTAGWAVCNSYIFQAYQYLFADAIPQELMGRFIGIYRAVGAIAGFVFNRYMFGWAEHSPWAIYALAAFAFGTAFLLLVWRVKEGEYPPPPPKKHVGLINISKMYVHECFSIPFYLKLYTIALCFWSATGPFSGFSTFFAIKRTAENMHYAPTLDMTPAQLGEIRAWPVFVAIPVFLLVGPFLDRFHPLRIVIAGLASVFLTFLLGFFFVNTPAGLGIWLLVFAAAQSLYLGAYLAMFPRLLPRAKFGQFFSANEIFGKAGVVFTAVLSGVYMEFVQDYRYIFLWAAVIIAVGLISAIALYRHWIKLGGDTAYVPPERSPA